MDRHLPQLDGIRAVAILLVLIAHFWPNPVGYPLVNDLLFSGRIGVDLFFVLSGFLITGILWKTRGESDYYKNFYGRRALRIFPAYFAFLFVLLIVMPESKENAPVRDDWFYYVGFLSNIDIALEGWRWRISDVTWSLAVEEQFYLFWPFLLRTISTKAAIRLCLSMILLVPLARLIGYGSMPVISVFVLTPFRMDAFAVGALISIVIAEKLLTMDQLTRLARWVLLAVTPPLLVCCVLNVWEKPGALTAMGFTFIALFTGGLLVLSLRGGRVASALSIKPLRHIGKVSYGLYLYHSLCYVVVTKVIDVIGITSGYPLADSIAIVIGVGAVSIAFSTLSFRYFETPFLRLKRFFERKAPNAVAPVGSAAARSLG